MPYHLLSREITPCHVHSLRSSDSRPRRARRSARFSPLHQTARRLGASSLVHAEPLDFLENYAVLMPYFSVARNISI